VTEGVIASSQAGCGGRQRSSQGGRKRDDHGHESKYRPLTLVLDDDGALSMSDSGSTADGAGVTAELRRVAAAIGP
jgi:hypothetical protein